MRRWIEAVALFSINVSCVCFSSVDEWCWCEPSCDNNQILGFALPSWPWGVLRRLWLWGVPVRGRKLFALLTLTNCLQWNCGWTSVYTQMKIGRDTWASNVLVLYVSLCFSHLPVPPSQSLSYTPSFSFCHCPVALFQSDFEHGPCLIFYIIALHK